MTEDLQRTTRSLGYCPVYDDPTLIGPPACPLSDNVDKTKWLEGSIEQPVEVSATLYPHQLKSVGDMERFEEKRGIELNDCLPNPGPSPMPLGLCASQIHNRKRQGSTRILKRRFGVQADPVGYGKTLSMVTLIARDKMNFDVSRSYEIHTTQRNPLYEWDYTCRIPKIPITLVLASSSCINQWLDDFNKTNLQVLVVRNKKTIRDWWSRVRSTAEPVFEYDVILVVPSMFNILLRKNRLVCWKRFIYDEPAHVSVPAMEYPTY